MENTWKIGFLGLLVLAGTGLVMAELVGQGVKDSATVGEKTITAGLDGATCSGGCGQKLGSCGADCSCGCQKAAGTCTGDCGKALDACTTGCGCGCSRGG